MQTLDKNTEHGTTGMHSYNRLLLFLKKHKQLLNKLLIGCIIVVGIALAILLPTRQTPPLLTLIKNASVFTPRTVVPQQLTPTMIPTPTASPSPTLIPTPTPSPTPTAVPTPTTPPVSNTLPGNGYSSQYVQTDTGIFRVNLIAGDLNSTRVVVDTASDGTCTSDCPALPVATYAQRSGAYAAINGTFFCPPDYASCAGKTNSFDTLLMNKNKTYFNSDNNVYSTVPLLYVSGTTMGVRGQSLEWGRDTGVDAVIANHPLYIAGGNNAFGGSSDAKITSKGTRTFIGNKGSTAYIGFVSNASAAEAAAVLKTLQFDNALGLDQGGSTALWFNGSYIAGPGRNVPNAILFLRK